MGGSTIGAISLILSNLVGCRQVGRELLKHNHGTPFPSTISTPSGEPASPLSTLVWSTEIGMVAVRQVVATGYTQISAALR